LKSDEETKNSDPLVFDQKKGLNACNFKIVFGVNAKTFIILRKCPEAINTETNFE